jgi:hypothetical protein
MSSQDQSPRELAKQGDPKVIANAINRSLISKGIKADVMRDNGCLHVMMEGDQVPHYQKDLVKLVRNGMDRLGVETIYTVRVYGRQFGDDLPVWEEEIVLRTPPEPMINLADDIDLDQSSVPLVDDQDEDYNIDDEIIDDDFIHDEDEYVPSPNNNVAATYNPEEDDDPDDEIEETTRQVEPKKPKSKVLPLILLGVLGFLAILGGLHFTGIFRLPFLPAGSSSSGESADTPSVPVAADSPKPATSAAVTADPFSEAVKTAINTANLVQKAQTKAEWTKVGTEWKRASELMKKVPKSHPKFSVAEDRAVQYANNQKIAEQKAAAAPN